MAEIDRRTGRRPRARGAGRGHIFINYRRGDADWAASLLQLELSNRFGSQKVFFASKSLEVGDRFEKELLAAAAGAKVLLAVIGSEWFMERGGEEPALLNENDFVRREIAAALRGGAEVFPVYVDGAPALRAEDLPTDIAEIAEEHGLVLHLRMSRTWARLIGDELVGKFPDLLSPAGRVTFRVRRLWESRRRPLLLSLMVSCSLLATLSYGFLSPLPDHDDPHAVKIPEDLPPGEIHEARVQRGRSIHTFADFWGFGGEGNPVPSGTWVRIGCRWKYRSDSPSVGEWWYLAGGGPWNGRWLVANSYVTRTVKNGIVTGNYDGSSDPDVDPAIPICVATDS
ncbi:MAG: hypothetical protein QG608_2767 [Actinomycetota bacterium]|nr:hypothetical protein [Actinomycetota bacterium]